MLKVNLLLQLKTLSKIYAQTKNWKQRSKLKSHYRAAAKSELKQAKIDRSIWRDTTIQKQSKSGRWKTVWTQPKPEYKKWKQMANDLQLNDPRLKDPIRQIPDGLNDPVEDKTPGFFQSLRNPHELMLEESLPASLYQWITGNTKKKQAQEALEYIRNNPNLAGTPIYKEAERKLQRSM